MWRDGVFQLQRKVIYTFMSTLEEGWDTWWHISQPIIAPEKHSQFIYQVWQGTKLVLPAPEILSFLMLHLQKLYHYGGKLSLHLRKWNVGIRFILYTAGQLEMGCLLWVSSIVNKNNEGNVSFWTLTTLQGCWRRFLSMQIEQARFS